MRKAGLLAGAVLLLMLHSLSAADDTQSSLADLLLVNEPIVYREEQFISRIRARTGETREPVGLVLSGGSARAFAHIGVLLYLEEVGIVPDFIVSNSMGSIVGLLYGAGLSPSQIHELIRNTDMGELFSLQLPLHGGLLDPGRLSGLIRRYLDDLVLEELPIPVMVICEDLETKQEIRIAEGDFYTVLEAAYALPIYFPPVAYRGHRLIDGGITNLVPLAPAYAYTDTVIASTAFYYNPSLNLNNPLTILNVAMDIGKGRAGVRELIEYEPLLIRCDVENFSFMDFDRIDTIVALGRSSAEEAEEALRSVHGGDAGEELAGLRERHALTISRVSAEIERLNRIPPVRPRVRISLALTDGSEHFGALPGLDMGMYASLYAAADRPKREASLGGGFLFGGNTGGLQPAANFRLSVTPSYWITGTALYRQAWTSLNDSPRLSHSYISASAAAVPFAGRYGRLTLTVSGEAVFDNLSRSADSLVQFGGRYGYQYSRQNTLEVAVGSGLYADASAGPGAYAEGELDLPFAAAWGAAAEGMTRISLSSSGKVPVYIRDYPRSSLPTADSRGLTAGSLEIYWKPISFRPTFAELVVVRKFRLSGYADLISADHVLYWSAGLQGAAEIALIGIKPFTLTGFIGYDSAGGRIRAGILL
jgi:NTE family protein